MKDRIYKTTGENGKITKKVISDDGAVRYMEDVSRFNRKIFAVIVKCGHTSDKFHYIPIMFSIHANSKEGALATALHTARAKTSDYGKQSNCLAIFEITYSESMLIAAINDLDPYLLAHSRSDYTGDVLKQRELLQPGFIKIDKETGELSTPTGEKLRFDTDYREDQVLERYLAPKKVGGHIIIQPPMPKKADLMFEFFSQKMKTMPFTEESLEDFSSYFKLFGHVQPQPIKMWIDGNKLFCEQNGEIKGLELPKKITDNWKRHEKEFSTYSNYSIKKSTMEVVNSIPIDVYEDAMAKRREKIQARFARYNIKNTTNESQPGDE